jgi:hypothetical protein
VDFELKHYTRLKSIFETKNSEKHFCLSPFFSPIYLMLIYLLESNEEFIFFSFILISYFNIFLGNLLYILPVLMLLWGA